jgi:hypothetical protein|tara:strand:+ start:133 stop:366 length:234 start_codon:yes stop_codon:yes gene_type:complete
MKFLIHLKNKHTGEIYSRHFEKLSFEQSASAAYLLKNTLNDQCDQKGWRLIGLYEIQYNEKNIKYPPLEKEMFSKIS